MVEIEYDTTAKGVFGNVYTNFMDPLIKDKVQQFHDRPRLKHSLILFV